MFLSQDVAALRNVFIDTLNSPSHFQELRNPPKTRHIDTVDFNPEIGLAILTFNLADAHLAMVPDEVHTTVGDELLQDFLRLICISHTSEDESSNMAIVQATATGKDPFTGKDLTSFSGLGFNGTLILCHFVDVVDVLARHIIIPPICLLHCDKRLR